MPGYRRRRSSRRPCSRPGPGLSQRVGVGLEVAPLVDRGRARQVGRRRAGAGRGQRPGRDEGRAAVVVGDRLDQVEPRRIVVVGDRAGGALAQPDGDLSISAPVPVPPSSSSRRPCSPMGPGLSEGVGVGLEGRTAVDRGRARQVGRLAPVPVAVSVQAATRAVPPLSLVTVLSRLRPGALSLLLIVQVALSPSPTVILLMSAPVPGYRRRRSSRRPCSRLGPGLSEGVGVGLEVAPLSTGVVPDRLVGVAPARSRSASRP